MKSILIENLNKSKEFKDKKDKKDNKKLLLLSLFGILFVVFGHCGKVNIFLNNVFPYYSFHMALFTFISGYFFRDIKFQDFIKKKTKRLIISYIIWNIIYGIVINILNNIGLINYGKNFNLYNIFIAPFVSSSNQFVFNISAWFIISIYFVQLIYFLINKINSKVHFNTKYVLMIFSIIIAIIELEQVKNGCNFGIWYLITRISFLMPFYCLGQIYKEYEKYDKLNNITYFVVLIIVQTILLQKFKNVSYNLNILSFKHNYIIYLISSITGIMFWLRVSSILEKYIGNNKIINYIGNNTYTVMMHHVFIFFIINTIMLIINKSTGLLGNFDFNSYRNSIWYIYNKNNAGLIMIYVILGIAIPLLTKYFFIDKILIKLVKDRKTCKNTIT